MTDFVLEKIEGSDLYRVNHVPIVETGIEYPASTGPVTFTTEDLSSIVGAQDDPAIRTPRVKLGHTDPRFNSNYLDGEPAFGILANMNLENEGQTVYADIVGIPKWLGDIIPFAFPNRSIEGNWSVKTVTGHEWDFVCTDIALLGVVWPGISTLEDLEIAFSADGPKGVEVAKSIATVLSGALAASTNMEDVRRAFYEEVATGDRFWWWVRAVLIDPNELIADDDEGGLFRVPFSVNGSEVTFEDPVEVKIQYVDQVAARLSVAMFKTSQVSRPADRQEGKKLMANIDEKALRRVLNLPEDASDEAVNQALQQKAEQQPETPETPETPPAEALPSDVATPESSAEPPNTEAGTVRVDSATLAALQRDAELGRQAFENDRIRARDQVLQAAVLSGKFPPARVEHWAKAWENEFKALGNADGVKAAIAAMPDGLVPVGPGMGVNPNVEGNISDVAYPKGWLPEVHSPRGERIQQES